MRSHVSPLTLHVGLETGTTAALGRGPGGEKRMKAPLRTFGDRSSRG